MESVPGGRERLPILGAFRVPSSRNSGRAWNPSDPAFASPSNELAIENDFGLPSLPGRSFPFKRYGSLCRTLTNRDRRFRPCHRPRGRGLAIPNPPDRLARVFSHDARSALQTAQVIRRHRCAAFTARHHRPPTDAEWYLLWTCPARVDHPGPIKTARAARFANLCFVPSGPQEPLPHRTACTPPPLPASTVPSLLDPYQSFMCGVFRWSGCTACSSGGARAIDREARVAERTPTGPS
jgi:hypothetical protein